MTWGDEAITRPRTSPDLEGEPAQRRPARGRLSPLFQVGASALLHESLVVFDPNVAVPAQIERTVLGTQPATPIIDWAVDDETAHMYRSTRLTGRPVSGIAVRDERRSSVRAQEEDAR